MNINIEISNIIEWGIALFLGIFGWFIAIKSTISQQKHERYNDLIHDFHSSIYDFRFQFLQDFISRKNNDKYIIQMINTRMKFIYWKARDLDSIVKKDKDKIYEKIKDAGEKFNDTALLDNDIENALISSDDQNELAESQRGKFLQLANKFIEECYSISKFHSPK